MTQIDWKKLWWIQIQMDGIKWWLFLSFDKLCFFFGLKSKRTEALKFTWRREKKSKKKKNKALTIYWKRCLGSGSTSLCVNLRIAPICHHYDKRREIDHVVLLYGCYLLAKGLYEADQKSHPLGTWHRDLGSGNIQRERERWWALNADKNYHTHVPVVQEMLEISKQTSQKGEFLLYLVSWNFDREPCIWPHQNLWAMNEAVPLQNEILSQ